MSENYRHEGWIGKPYESAFKAKWGRIELEQMLDVTYLRLSNQRAAELARSKGYQYMIVAKQSVRGNRLYYVSSGYHCCVFQRLDQQKSAAQRNKLSYTNNISFKIGKLLSSIRRRSSYCDISADDLLPRFERGVCEATGMPLNLTTPNSPFSPSLDQIIPGKGYTRDNVQVVCMIFNQMKSDYDISQVRSFVAFLRSKDCTFNA